MSSWQPALWIAIAAGIAMGAAGYVALHPPPADPRHVLLPLPPEAALRPNAWSVDPQISGPRLPPAGRSLFDHVFSEKAGGAMRYRVPFPFSALVDRLRATLGPESPDNVRVVLIPLGRSLQRQAAIDQPFTYPRVVLAVTGNPRARGGALLKDRLYLGYNEKMNLIEVISYNEAAGRFEFQMVKDYRSGATPNVVYANRTVCIACHQNHAPIFSRGLWQETNANKRVGALLASARKNFYGFSPSAQVDEANAIDDATERANALITAQAVWRRGCAPAGNAAPPAAARSRRCRAALLLAALQYGLSGERRFARAAQRFQIDFLQTLAIVQRERWPQGLALPDPDVPNRNPFPGGDPELLAPSGADGSGAALRDQRSSDDDANHEADYETEYETEANGRDHEHSRTNWRAVSHVPAVLEPLAPRPPRERLSFRQRGEIDRVVAAVAQLFAADDFRALDEALRAHAESAQRTTVTFACSLSARRTGAPAANALALRCGNKAADGQYPVEGRLPLAESGAGASIDRLALDDDELRDLDWEIKSIDLNGARQIARGALAHNGLNARLSDARAITQIALAWRSASEPGALTIELNDDAKVLQQAIDDLALTDALDSPDGAPLQRARVMPALLERLGAARQDWCCAGADHLPRAESDELPAQAGGAQAVTELEPFYRYCGACHFTPERAPANFLAGDRAQVVANFVQCAPRLFARLSMWDESAQARSKTPMPPATALHGLDTGVADWQRGGKLAALKGYVAGIIRQSSGSAADLHALLAAGYEALPPCLPAQ